MEHILDRACEVLKTGGTILYPTDTIWGIGCDATNPEAVESVYQMKKRVDRKSMLILVYNEEMLRSYVREIPSMALELMNISDSPITIIYPGAQNLATNLVAEDGSIGIRVCKTDFCQNLIARFQKPIVSTSANISGQPPPKQRCNIHSELMEMAGYCVPEPGTKYVPSDKPSSIIKLGIDNSIQIIRK